MGRELKPYCPPFSITCTARKCCSLSCLPPPVPVNLFLGKLPAGAHTPYGRFTEAKSCSSPQQAVLFPTSVTEHALLFLSLAALSPI